MTTLSPELLERMNAYWCAANYLSVGQIYLKDNPLLDRPLSIQDIKPRSGSCNADRQYSSTLTAPSISCLRAR